MTPALTSVLREMRDRLWPGPADRECIVRSSELRDWCDRIEALSAAPAGEPVASVAKFPDYVTMRANERQLELLRALPNGAPLYAHPAPAAQEGWRGIESAPKDGTAVLLHFKNAPALREPDGFQGRQFVGMWASEFWKWSFAAPIGYGGITDDSLDGWQHLPPPPEPSNG